MCISAQQFLIFIKPNLNHGCKHLANVTFYSLSIFSCGVVFFSIFMCCLRCYFSLFSAVNTRLLQFLCACASAVLCKLIIYDYICYLWCRESGTRLKCIWRNCIRYLLLEYTFIITFFTISVSVFAMLKQVFNMLYAYI